MVIASPRIAPAGSDISIRAVSHRFDLEGAPLPVLDDVSLEIQPGSFVALLGPSGCGKSTLLRLVAGLDHPSAGEITVDGDRVADPDPSRILVFQDPTLFPWRTVRANVALGLEAQGTLKSEGAASMTPSGLWALTVLTVPIRTSCRAAWRSGWPWRVRWSIALTCCFWTNRWASWTA